MGGVYPDQTTSTSKWLTTDTVAVQGFMNNVQPVRRRRLKENNIENVSVHDDAIEEKANGRIRLKNSIVLEELIRRNNAFTYSNS